MELCYDNYRITVPYLFKHENRTELRILLSSLLNSVPVRVPLPSTCTGTMVPGLVPGTRYVVLDLVELSSLSFKFVSASQRAQRQRPVSWQGSWSLLYLRLLRSVKVKKAKGNPNINMGNKAATTAPPLYDESIEHYVRRGHFYRHSKDNDTDLGELPPHHEKVALAAGRC